MVEEVLGFDPPGEGAHHWICLRCRMQNTSDVARMLSRAAGKPVRDIGFSGRKDRRAVTTQWFSLPCARSGEKLDDSVIRSIAETEGIELVSVSANRRKIRRGVHARNRFRIVARGVTGNRTAIESRLVEIHDTGVPNYFGPQRFGHQGGNLRLAERLFSGPGARLDRNRRSLALSAARAHLFNLVLSHRVMERNWNSAVLGDVMQFSGGRASFHNDGSDATVADRIARGEIHPTGPLWGAGPPTVSGEVAAMEEHVVSTMPLFSRGLCRFGMKQERRALRLIPERLAWSFEPNENLLLNFELPAGAFATALLRELLSSGSLNDRPQRRIEAGEPPSRPS